MGWPDDFIERYTEVNYPITPPKPLHVQVREHFDAWEAEMLVPNVTHYALSDYLSDWREMQERVKP
jgi:hypothetical protein